MDKLDLIHNIVFFVFILYNYFRSTSALNNEDIDTARVYLFNILIVSFIFIFGGYFFEYFRNN